MAKDSAFDVLIGSRGYLLARSTQLGYGARAWSVKSSSQSTANLSPSERMYATQPSVAEAPMVWKSAHLGYGADRQIQEGRYNWATNVDARFPEQVLPGPLITELTASMGENVLGFFEQDGQLFFVGGRYCKRVTPSDDIELAKDFGANTCATGLAVHNSTAYVAMGFHEAFWQRAGALFGIWDESYWDEGSLYFDPTLNWSQACIPAMTQYGADFIVDCGSGATIDNIPAADYTWEAWVRLDSAGEGGAGVICSKGTMFRVSCLVSSIKIETTHATSVASAQVPFTYDGEWHHLMAVYDVGTLTFEYFFLDGYNYLVSSVTGVGAYTTDAAAIFYIGNVAANDKAIDGDLSWMRFSNTKLQSVFFTPEVDPPATVATTIEQWNFDELDGATVAAQVTTPGCDGTASDYRWIKSRKIYMGVAAPFKERLWASSSPSEARCVAADPKVEDNWSAEYAIGNPGEHITAMMELGDLLYVGKADGLYVLDSTGVAQALTPELRAYRDLDNCVNMAAWHGSMWIPQIRGLLNYQNLGTGGFVVIPATPGYDSGEDNPIRGRITAMAGDSRWLYAALLTQDGDTYIMAGRETNAGEASLGRMIWHPLALLENTECGAMYISSLWANPRLFFGMNDDIGYIILPRSSDNPLQDSACRYTSGGSIYYPAHTWMAPTTQKVWSTVEIEADNLLLGRFLDIYFRVDREGEWQSLGRVTMTPYHILKFPDYTTGKDLELRVDFVVPSSAKPIVLRTLLARAAERPTGISLITATIRCADNLPTRTGAKCNRTGATMIEELRACARMVEPVTLIDPLGATRTVLVLDPIEERESEQEGDEAPEVLAVVHMVTFEREATAESYQFGVYGESVYDDTAVVYR